MKSAFVTVAGRPSAGKSTLINRICGHKVSIVSGTPQTTRNVIRGIYTEERGQIVFLDTPGYHLSDKKINTELKTIAETAMEDGEAILYVVDSQREPGEEEKKLLDFISQVSAPVITAINKIDSSRGYEDSAVTKKTSNQLDELEVFIRKRLQKMHSHRKISFVRVSAKLGDGVPDLLTALFEVLPEGELMYPADIYTDQDVEFRISEIIREKAINRTREEVPHSIYVEIADMEMVKNQQNNESLWVRAFLVVESESQKGIVIGQGGEKIRAIKLAAKREVKSIFPYPVTIDLRVKVNPHWRNRKAVISRLMH